jgi:undecaprenyl pyrophosphate phosphatase UppP
MTFDFIKAIILGIVEGLTEFIPVSSTGHLLLMQRFFGFGDDDFGKSFAVLIQFGAILALLSIYSMRLWQLFIGLFNDPQARRFVIGVLIAFLPAAVVGALAYKIIKEVLFNPWIVCFSLIAGGAVLLWVDRLNIPAEVRDLTLRIRLFHIADDGLPTIVHIDVLDADKLLPAVTQASTNLNLGCVSPHQTSRRRSERRNSLLCS